jgi:hypothetical protein
VVATLANRQQGIGQGPGLARSGANQGVDLDEGEAVAGELVVAGGIRRHWFIWLNNRSTTLRAMQAPVGRAWIMSKSGLQPAKSDNRIWRLSPNRRWRGHAKINANDPPRTTALRLVAAARRQPLPWNRPLQ